MTKINSNTTRTSIVDVCNFFPPSLPHHLFPFSVYSLSHIHTRMHTYAHTHTYTHVCTRMHMHTHTHAHTHARTRTHTHTHCNFLPNLPALQMSHLPLVLGTLITCEFLISSFVFSLLAIAVVHIGNNRSVCKSF